MSLQKSTDTQTGNDNISKNIKIGTLKKYTFRVTGIHNLTKLKSFKKKSIIIISLYNL